MKQQQALAATILLLLSLLSMPLTARDEALGEWLQKNSPKTNPRRATNNPDDEGEGPGTGNTPSNRKGNGETPGLYDDSSRNQNGRGRQGRDRSQPAYRVLRLHLIDGTIAPDHRIAGMKLFYDYFSGHSSMVHLSLGYNLRDYTTTVDARGPTFGLLYGFVSGRKHFSDGALALSWDIGGFIDTADLDGTDGGSVITGRYEDYQFRFGLRGNLFTRHGSSKSVTDLWLSGYTHLIAGRRKFERYTGGTPDILTEKSGVGIAWGLIFTSRLLSFEAEFGYYHNFYLRFGAGFALNL